VNALEKRIVRADRLSRLRSQAFVGLRQSFRLRHFRARSRDDLRQVNVQRGGYFQNRLQGWISVAIFDVCNHLRRQPGFLSDKVFGEFSPLSFLAKQRNDSDAQFLGVSIHPAELQENGVDSAFHYGGIVGRDGMTLAYERKM